MVVTHDAAGQSSLNARLRDTRDAAHFTWQTLIAPWPPYALFLVITGVIGGLIPLVQIRVISGLINTLTVRRATALARHGRSLALLLAPYLPWLLLLLAMMILSWLIYADTFQGYLAAQLDERVREQFDRRFYQKALSLRLEQFESTSTYDTMHRARRAIGESVVSDQLAGMQRCLSVMLGCVGIVWALSAVHWAIAGMLLSGSVLTVWCQIWSMRKAIAVDYSHAPLRRKQDYWRSLLTQRGPAAEVRLFGLGEHILGAWRRLTEQMLDEVLASSRGSIRRFHTLLAGNIGLHSLVVLALILSASRGTLSAGSFVALLYVIRDYPDRIHNMGWWLQRFHRFLAELHYAREFLSLPADESKAGAPAAASPSGGVRFEGVAFVYPASHRPALAGIDLHVQPGERVALVGENGAGKSTFARLLLGLYQPTTGRITCGGIDLRPLGPEAWRARVGAVFQDYMRYSLTARENIGFGRLEKLNDLPCIEEAARLSSAAEVIGSLPHGYETLLGKEFEGGHDLSQGQWQKLAIARAYLRDAEILVLDEPASALDALAEREVYRQFLEISRGKTVLLISHRLGSARLADRILFLQEGRIIQEGTHDELLAAGGPYADLYQIQAEWYRQPEQHDEVKAAHGRG